MESVLNQRERGGKERRRGRKGGRKGGERESERERASERAREGGRERGSEGARDAAQIKLCGKIVLDLPQTAEVWKLDVTNLE